MGGTGSEVDFTQTVLYRMARLAKLYRNELAKKLTQLDIYIGQEQVLLNIREPEGVSQAELGDRVKATPATLTKMLQRMERGGLVRRERSDSRGRASRVFLTEYGWTTRHTVERLWQQAESRLTAGLTREEAVALSRLLDKLTAGEVTPRRAEFDS
ncbi:transcriptional regulator, MarR family [Micromonospora carbonacea]|uniref:Transcriptional regulator, MarR family n=2 Tax=Micromonospora carbonacea TaxID=47853 RepID=A0A1C4VEL9_9ACTN|nr:transcriptional regulator, MarR family [Micromonospora carbonacea]